MVVETPSSKARVLRAYLTELSKLDQRLTSLLALRYLLLVGFIELLCPLWHTASAEVEITPLAVLIFSVGPKLQNVVTLQAKLDDLLGPLLHTPFRLAFYSACAS